MSLLSRIREYVDPNYNPPALPHITSERSRAVAQHAVRYIRPRMGRRAFSRAIARAEREIR